MEIVFAIYLSLATAGLHSSQRLLAEPLQQP